MRRLFFAVLFTLLCVAPPVLAQSPQHPRLLFAAADIPALKAKAQNGVGGDDAAYDKLFSLANTALSLSFPLCNVCGYSETQTIELLGVAAQLADDAEDRVAYAGKCRTLATAMVNTPLLNGADAFDGGHRMFALSYALDMCFEGADPQQRADLVAAIDAILRQFYYRWDRYHYPPYTSNKGLMGAAGMGMAAIVLQGEAAVQPTHLSEALALSSGFLGAHMVSVAGSDGAYTEGVLYGAWSMRFLAPYFEARRRFDGVDLGAATNFTQMVEWMAYGVRPNAQAWVENLNDTLASTYPLAMHSTLLEWAMHRLQSGIAAWIWNKEMPHRPLDASSDVVAMILWNDGLAPENPGATLAKERVFPHRGLYYSRTGWPDAGQAGSDDTVFSFYSGKYWGGHAQEDQGQFTLFAHGIDFVKDTGISAMAMQSRGHNVILVNPLSQPGEGDQHKAGSSIGTDGSLVDWLLSPFADFVHSDNKAAYTTHSEFNNPGQPYPFVCTDTEYPVERADRFVLSVKRTAALPEYFAIFDDMRKNGNPTLYRWLLHSQRDNCFDMQVANRVRIYKSNADCNSLCLDCGELDVVFVSPTLQPQDMQEDIYASGSGDGETRRLKASVNAVEPEFFVLLMPRAAGASAPTVTRPTTSGGVAARIAWPGTNIVDRVLFARGGDQAAAEEVTLTGRSAVLRKTGGLYTQYSLSEGALLQAGPLAVATVWEGTASVASDGARITVSDPNGSYTLYGPNITSVVDADGAPVPYLKVQKFVYINSDPPAGGGPEF